MGSEMKVEVIAKEIVVPSSPTPYPYQTQSLSYFNQVAPDMNNCISHNNVPSICCNDHGAAFIQTRVNCPASKALGKYHDETLNQLFPNALESTFESTGYLLLVQANFFECGGLAIGVCISHKIADGFTLSTFIRSWAAISLGSGTSDVIPHLAEFGVPAFENVPELNFTSSSKTSPLEFHYKSCATRRFVFDASKIVSLKSIAISATVPNPTRVEVVSAIIWKCTRPFVLCHAVNMRKLMRQPSLMGNFVGMVRPKTFDGEVNLQGLVGVLREGFEDFKVKYGNAIGRDNIVCEYLKEIGSLNEVDRAEMLMYSSWCKFDFYEGNFGWGKPLWVGTLVGTIENMVVLLDTRDGEGIEAILTMNEEDMAVIETNKELLAYASLNPNII